ncbi:Protein SODIUM POTASSIUM ROOT DEFECTIVE 1, partial [Cucurbita argyrosperma subsp. sororia]
MKRFDLFCKSRASTAVRSSFGCRPVAGDVNSGDGRKVQLHFEKPRKSTSVSSVNRKDHIDLRRKSCADMDDLKNSSVSGSGDDEPGSKKASSLSRSLSVHESPSSVLESPVLKTSSSAHSRVVVLKVSLNCKGCEKKVKRHISKMEGVISYSVDFTTKKVTIIGDVIPVDVLASVSKVKHAELWPSPSFSSSSSSSTPQCLSSSSSTTRTF